MKLKKILAAGLALSMLLGTVSGLTACGEHTHQLDAVEKKAATCTEAGYEAYYKCSGCDKLFSDEKGEKEIEAPTAIPAGHKIEEVKKKDATCKEAGAEAHYKCTVCNKLFSDAAGKNVITAATPIPVAKHTIIDVSKKRPTCTEAGYEEHYKCSVCNKLFSDEEGTTEIEEASIVIPAEHRIIPVAKKEANCSEAGYEAHYKCELCNKLYSDENATTEITAPIVIPQGTEHTVGFGFTADTIPAPVAEGGTLNRKCTVCGKAIDTISYLKGSNVDASKVSAPFTLDASGNYYAVVNDASKISSYIGFHATKAGTYKLTFTNVYSQATLTKMFSGVYITEDAYPKNTGMNLWSLSKNTWATTTKLQETITKFKDKIVREETESDYSNAYGVRTTLNSITFTFAEEDIPEGGLYVMVTLQDKIKGTDGIAGNPTEKNAYLIKFEAPEEQAQA